jgi:HEAT repeat protein
MSRTFAGITLALFWAILQSASSQQPPVAGSVKLYRYGELLQEHGVELTRSGLLNALGNSDSSVRYLAAMKLAEDKTADAVPAIEQALAVEKVPRSQVNLALALALLGDQAGNTELKKICTDREVPSEFRLYAVQYMFDLHVQKDEDCFKAAEDVIESKNTRLGDRVSALGLLSRFRGLTAEEARDVLRLVAVSLADPELVVRMAAGQSFAGLGDPSAIPYLEAAVKRESDESVRSVLKSALNKLREVSSPPNRP